MLDAGFADHYADDLQLDLEDIMNQDFNAQLEDDSPLLVLRRPPPPPPSPPSPPPCTPTHAADCATFCKELCPAGVFPHPKGKGHMIINSNCVR